MPDGACIVEAEGRAMAGRIGKPRKSGDPTPATVRKIGILLDLVRHRRISLGACRRTYGASERTLLRDLQELRQIGESAGFKISDRGPNDSFTLSEFKARPSSLLAGEKRFRSLIAELLKAFGEPLQSAAGGLDPGSADDAASFLHVVQPRLVGGSAVARTYDELEAAWRNDARVRFTYKGQSRTVEPAAAMVRSGRYYLVARDVEKGNAGWRIFSMDQIAGPIVRAGTFARKAAPPKYASTDTIGWFKGDGEKQTVEVTFSKELAPAAASRQWQTAQTAVTNADGTVTISLQVYDVDEVIRWSLGFADEAWISAPPSTVRRAEETLKSIRSRYP
jgi:predicted DNA-binding transcriptional regulator YafY